MKNNFKHKNVLVYGVSISGEWASRLLNKLKANVYIYDDDKGRLNKAKIKNAYLIHELNEMLIGQFDFLVVSPSIPLDNPYLMIAKRLNKRIYSEVEFASLFSRNLVAITGTNGKTTTVELTAKMLSKKCKAVACGNNGYPLSRAVIENKRAVHVVEVSSFMLEHSSSFNPHIATITNIAPDHIIRHKTMDEYTQLKFSIFKNLTIKDYAVINLDLDIRPSRDCICITYSQKHMADIYLKNGYIYLRENRLIALNELKLKGEHNIYNAMCAIAIAYIYKVPLNKMREVLREYNSAEFRAQVVGKINDITFINDSKSTNIASTLACVNSLNTSIILLLGGQEKGLDYSELFKSLPKRIKQVVAFGEIADKLVMQNTDFKIEKADDLNSAFEFAVNIANPLDAIVLSPASASYDQFLNYIERGKAFNNLVHEYEKNRQNR